MVSSQHRVKGDKATRHLCVAGIIGNGALILVWLVTRTIGILFFGPNAGEAEKIGGMDVLSKLFEVALMACLLAVMRLTYDSTPGIDSAPQISS